MQPLSMHTRPVWPQGPASLTAASAAGVAHCGTQCPSTHVVPPVQLPASSAAPHGVGLTVHTPLSSDVLQA